MRTKTVLLSALVGAIGTVSALAQTNVYSLNAVGYINVSAPPGYSILSCPLICSPDNTMNTLMNNGAGNPYGPDAYDGCQVFFWYPSINNYVTDTAEKVGSGTKGTTVNTNGWALNGTNALNPGVGAWFYNDTTTNFTFTFVGTVPTGPVTNTLGAGFSLVGSVVPMSGDLVTNSISGLTNYNLGDVIYSWSPAISNYVTFTSGSGKAFTSGYKGNWTSVGDPTLPTVGEGFWYQNNANIPVSWVENYSVSQ